MLRTFERLGVERAAAKARNVQFSGLGRRGASSSTKESVSAEIHTQKTNSTGRQRLQHGTHSDVQQKADSIDVPTLLWYKRLGPVTNFFSWYDRTQTKSPYSTQFFSSLLIYFIGDQLAQAVGGEPYDGKRTVRHLIIGAISSLPGYRWFIFLGSNFNYPSKLLSIAAKILVQQVVFAPIFNTYFFGMQAILSGDDMRGVIRRIQGAVPDSVVNSLKFWPAVTAFSFTFIQPQYRFLFSGGFATLWQTYLSYVNRREEVRAGVAAGETKVGQAEQEG